MLCFVQTAFPCEASVVSVPDDLVPSHLADDPLPTPVAGHAARGPEKMLGEWRKLETVVEEDSGQEAAYEQ